MNTGVMHDITEESTGKTPEVRSLFDITQVARKLHWNEPAVISLE